MSIQSKPFYSSFLLCVVASILFISITAIAEEEKEEAKPSPPLFNPATAAKERDSGKTMKSMSWNTPKPKEEKDTEESEIEKTPDDNKDNQPEEEKELTPEQKLWKKYKDLAAGTDPKEDEQSEEDSDDNESSTDEDDKADKDHVPTEKQEKKSGGLRGIIDNYKNSQENKGQMNSRSFGNID